MKNKALSLLGIFVAFLFLFSACEKSAIEEAQENYDYGKIIPDIVGGINGPASVVKTNTKKYSLGYFRGGSTWAWSATGAELQAIEGSNGNEVNVFFNQSNDELGDSVTVTVVETTQGGVVSDPATIRIFVSSFVISISGPAMGVASGAWVMNYSVPHDEGATYEWSVSGHTATVTPDASGGAAITWDLSATDITGGVSCVKTYKGLQSVPATFSTDLIGFLAKTRDDFAVAMSGEEMDGANSKGITSFTAIAGTETDEIVFPVDGGGISALFRATLIGWSEVFMPGYGNDGNIIVTMNMTTGAVTIEEQYWGATDWGVGIDPVYVYNIKGEGYWDGNDMTIHLDYNFLGPDFSTWEAYNIILTVI